MTKTHIKRSKEKVHSDAALVMRERFSSFPGNEREKGFHLRTSIIVVNKNIISVYVQLCIRAAANQCINKKDIRKSKQKVLSFTFSSSNKSSFTFSGGKKHDPFKVLAHSIFIIIYFCK